MIRTTLLAASLGVFALAAAPLAPAIGQGSAMTAEAATAKKKQTAARKKPAKKRAAAASNVQSKVRYDSGTRRWMTQSDYKYRYGR